MADKKDVRKFDTEESVAVALADYVAGLSEKFIKEKGSFTIVLSGGTPINTLRKLLDAPYKRTVDWVNWLVFWVDESVGPVTDPDNYFNRAKKDFLSKVPIPQDNFYPMMPIGGTPTPVQAAEYYDSRLKNLVQTNILPKSTTGYPQFDLMLLGLGPSGLVASLFPNRGQLSLTTPWVTFVTDAPTPPESRTTFLIPTINACSEIAIVATGIDLALPVYMALTTPRPPGVKLLPVEKVSPQQKLTWFLDENASFHL